MGHAKALGLSKCRSSEMTGASALVVLESPQKGHPSPPRHVSRSKVCDALLNVTVKPTVVVPNECVKLVIW